MAISDLIQNARSAFNGESEESDEQVQVQVPDDLSELETEDPGDLLEPDPRPVRKGPTKKRQATGKATAAQKRQITDSVELMLEILGGAASMRDPICGGALQDVSSNAAARCVPIITRSPVLLEFFAGAGAPWMEYVALFVALKPFVETVWAHHVTKSIGHDHETEGAAGDFSQYSTAAYGA